MSIVLCNSLIITHIHAFFSHKPLFHPMVCDGEEKNWNFFLLHHKPSGEKGACDMM
jgi:hypothetical protein